MKVIEFKDIKFKYEEDGPDILDGLNFSINKGEYTCILGHNGSGKSTASKLMCGLEMDFLGKVNVFGEELTHDNLTDVRKRIGVIFQNPDNQFIGNTVEDDIAFVLENQCLEREVIRAKVYKAAEQVQITDKLTTEPHKLSGGQKQRVAIAGVIAADNELIIFDESTSMLDPKGKREIKEMMVQLRNTHKKTIISITHDMDEAVLADKVIVLDQGKVAFEGGPSEVFKHYKQLIGMGLDSPFGQKLATLIDDEDIPSSIHLNEVINKICVKRINKNK